MATELFDNAKRNKKDEFYTQLEDIEKELIHYKKHFKDKVVFCNCDDPDESDFFKYFVYHFNELNLKKLITTCYVPAGTIYKQLDIFDVGNDKDNKENINKNKHKKNKSEIFDETNIKKAYKIIIENVPDKGEEELEELITTKELFNLEKNSKIELEGDGDFRSDECVELLKQSDIVVTNPPFSLFREYINQLIDYNKRFLIIGNQNAITYKEIFPLIKDNEIWLGVSMNGSNRYFKVPDDYVLTEKTGKIVDGKKYAFVNSVVWFTNMDINKRHEKIELVKKYSEEEYKKYDHYEAINVDKVSDIPLDYNGYIGVPITFLHKYSPEQFRIIDAINRYALLDVLDTNSYVRSIRSHTCNIDGKAKYFRIIIKRVLEIEKNVK